MSTKDILLGLAVALLWGFNFVVMKVGVAEIPPFLLAFLRFFLAAVPLVFFAAPPRAAWRIVIAYGMLFGVIKFGLLFSAFGAGMPAGLGAVVLQVQALFTVGLAGALLGERVTRAQMFGGAIAAAGLVLLAVDRFAGAPPWPFAMVLGAALAWGQANIAAKRAGPVDPLAFAVWTSFVATGPLLALSLAFEGPGAVADAWGRLSWRGAGAVLYLAYPISLASIAIWNGLLARRRAAEVAPFALLVPPIGLSLGWLLLGETITPMIVAGGACVVLGLAVALFADRSRRVSVATKRGPDATGPRSKIS